MDDTGRAGAYAREDLLPRRRRATLRSTDVGIVQGNRLARAIRAGGPMGSSRGQGPAMHP